MTNTRSCERSEELLGLIYGEAAGEERTRLESHVAGCPSCQNELSELRQVRKRLGEWKLPAWTKPQANGTPAWPRRLAVAAAILAVIGGGFRLTGGALRADSQGFHLAWGQPTNAPDVKALLAEAEERHRQEIEALRSSLATGTPTPVGDSTSLLRQVSQMIRESETRQAQVFRAGLVDMASETERRRRLDLAKVSAGLSYLDGKNGQQAARTTELMGYLIQASDRK